MADALHQPLPWWAAGPALGLVISALLGLADKRFGVLGGVTDIVTGSAEGRGLASWRVMLLLGIVLGGLLYTLAAGAPDAGLAYSYLDGHLAAPVEAAVLFAAGLAIGAGARTAGGCTSGHGLTGAALLSPASLASMGMIMATAVASTRLLDAAI
ncbi:MAG TPA: YeeE/YedE thiosulfate transporter family protein [Gaiellales bacterium]|nr:YeeE/YedE thiosulfate transporter family protein [Gaiellales bacterium]